MDAGNWRQRAGTGSEHHRTSKQQSDRAHRGPTDWQLGQVAYLRDVSQFGPKDYRELIKSGHLPKSATNHPVIVLDKSSDGKKYLVTTVSAYSSSAVNDYLPPWQQSHHVDMARSGFRAFRGSVKPDNEHKFLQLMAGQSWPKPETSWVYIHRVYLVPTSVLGFFTKARGVQLRMEKGSFDELVQDLKVRNPEFCRNQQQILQVRSVTPNTTERPSSPRHLSQPWRHAQNAQDRTRSKSPEAKFNQMSTEVEPRAITQPCVPATKNYSSALKMAVPNLPPVSKTCAAQIRNSVSEPRKWCALVRA
ncbi:hypothetical protein GGR57DRAFT_515979 [Xylariaceae sp. FL1272]|nr:hypothetical protein GGR57DRAFT_515979 [Xylariaceae sp. FL1272]